MEGDKQKILLCHMALTALALALALLPVPAGSFYGSEGDWYTQHLTIAESLRRLMLDTGKLIPQFVPLGGGSSIYDFAYYGLLRPDVLISCLMPSVNMKYIIAGYALLGYVASVNLCFYWLRKPHLKGSEGATSHSIFTPFFASVLFTCATCFYHSHHQIIFVNYMPFLITALLGVDRLIEKKKICMLTAGIFLIYIHSFFYAFSCLVACFIYFLSRLAEDGSGFKKGVRILVRAAAAVILATGMAAVLLLPTGLDILSTSKDGGAFAAENLKVFDFTLEGLLFSPYGCGMDIVGALCLAAGVAKKKTRLLSACLAVFFLFPIFSLVFNGFLYARAKILIPMLPLVCLVCRETCMDIFRSRHLAAAMLVLPVCVSLTANCTEKYIAGDKSLLPDADLDLNKLYRYELLDESFTCCNLIEAEGAGSTGMYSSVTNDSYSSFFYDTMKNAIPIRNRVALVPGRNVFFNYFMGVRYGLGGGQQIMTENEKVLPVCYGTTSFMKESEFKKLEFPYNIEALCFRTIISDEAAVSVNQGDFVSADDFETAIEELLPEQLLSDSASLSRDGKKQYDFVLQKKKEISLHLDKSIKDKILIIAFHVEAPSGHELVVTINGVTNKLSGATAPYPNNNNDFIFILPALSEQEGTLDLTFSKGEYSIRDIRLWVMNSERLTGDENLKSIIVPQTDYEHTAGNENEEMVFEGTVSMPKKGFFASSYPFRNGYKAYVDGKETKIEKINMSFMGFPLEGGNHHIKLTFTAPGYIEGKIASLTAAAVFVLIWIYEITERRRKNEKTINRMGSKA